MTEVIQWTEGQIMAARAIALIQDKLQPNCSECGSKVDRQKCAMDLGGHCPRSESDEYQNYRSVIESISRAASFPRDFNKRWDLFMPLHLYRSFSKSEINVLRDIDDGEGKIVVREPTLLHWDLCRKGAVGISAQDKYTIAITQRGFALLEHLKEEKKDAC